MLLKNYEQKGYFCNVSVMGATGTAGLSAYRGDLVVIEGDIADTQGRRHPPKAVIKQAVVLATDEKLKLLAGAVRAVEYLPEIALRYEADFADDIRLLFFVENIDETLSVTAGNHQYILVPYDDGAVWTMLQDELRLEKEDFKGQSAEDKVITMLEGFADYKPRAQAVTMDEAIAKTVAITKEARGPV